MENEIIQGVRLSPTQRRVWLLLQENRKYQARCLVCIEGTLDTNVLQNAVRSVLDRHEILRTTFHPAPGMKFPFQIITENTEPNWRVIDLQKLTQEEQQQKVDELFRDTESDFDLQHGFILEIHQILLSLDKQMLMICLPALCADFLSLKNLVAEIAVCYRAVLRDEELLNEPMQYADIAEWLHELLSDKDATTGKDYWKKKDFASLSSLTLPFERKASADSKFEPRFSRTLISTEVFGKISSYAQSINVPESSFLLACWYILIWRLTSQPEVIVGTSSDGRSLEDLRGAIGLFEKTLPVICRLQADFTFQEMVKQIYGSFHEASESQDYFSWESIVHSQNYASLPTYIPLCFDFKRADDRWSSSDLTFSVVDHSVCLDRSKLKLSFLQSEKKYALEFQYDADSFRPEEISRLTAQYQKLLESASNNPNQRIGELDILSDEEKRRILNDFNQTTTNDSEDRCIHQLFEEQARRNPDKIAVIFEEKQLTYVELNVRANRLAHRLHAFGVKPELPVALCVERSLEMIVGLLGILKAGGAYVPLDPALPEDRLEFMLHDTKAPVVVTQKNLLEKIPPSADIVVDIEEACKAGAAKLDENPASSAKLTNLAYVLFTSGSTGKPKGVEIEHKQIMNYLYGILPRLNLPAGSIFCTLSSFATDLGNTAIFPALVTGGCLQIASYERATDPQALAQHFEASPVDCLKIVPSHLAALLTCTAPERILPRKLLVLGGEASSWEFVEKIRKLNPRCAVLNHYGPTETTIGVTTYLVDQQTVDYAPKTVPIGRPINNTQIYILDGNKCPVPIWVPGEIYIGGSSVARGYMNRAEITSEKFIPNPFASNPKSRLYKTGDVGRFLPDGNIEFLGRVDFQIKLHGFRIELSEIEAVLNEHPEVREAVVVAREDSNSHKRLVAYVVQQKEPQIRVKDLRDHVKNKLPDHMVPSHFVLLRELPRTPSGKVERNALPAPDQIQDLERVSANPRTPLEQMLVNIWADLLNVNEIGIHDNFFELGGHSLLAMQLLSRVRSSFQVELPLRTLFEDPTISSLAARIEKTRNSETRFYAPPIRRLPRDQGLPLSFAQQRLWFLDQLEPESSAYNVPATIVLKGPLHITALEQSLQHIVKRHEVLRTTFESVSGKAQLHIHENFEIALPVLDLSKFDEPTRDHKVQVIATQEAQQPFDLSQGPLIRAKLLRTAEEEHVLLLTLHHIVSDGWSRGILFRELGILYESLSAGRSPSLPDLPIQYADFSKWQRDWLQGEVLDKQLSYWRKKLADAPPVLQLPADRAWPTIQTYNGAKESIVLSERLACGLKILSRREGVTMFMAVLAAFKTLLYRYTGQTDIIIGTPIAGRNRSETEGLIGFFVNNLTLRSDLSGNPTFRELLARVREVALQAYEHQDLPFEKLVEELHPKRVLSHSPIFQVFFNQVNFSDERVSFPGLIINFLKVVNESAKFDLTMDLVDEKESVGISLTYNTDLFDASTIQRMLLQFKSVLEGIVADPDQRLSDLSLVTQGELHRFEEWNATKKDYPHDRCVHRLFEKQVQRTPDAIAVNFQNHFLTYEELNRKANQLAHYVRVLGIGPEVTAAIYMEPSVEALVALLGILKAGGAFLPLSPKYPTARLEFMLKDSQAHVVLTQEHLAGLLPVEAANVVCMDARTTLFADHCEANPNTLVSSDNLSYVLYTSGSTGKPKAVMIQHKSLVNYLSWINEILLSSSCRNLPLLTELTFDASLKQLIAPLLRGDPVWIVPEEVISQPEMVLEELEKQSCSGLNCVPTLWKAILGVIEKNPMAVPANFMTLLIGGEQLTKQLVDRTFALLPQLEMWNLYGPTEATANATASRIIPQEPVTVGRPIHNAHIYLLDEHLNRVPLSISGEIYIGGAGVARGYLNHPDLTAEYFIPDPFSNHAGARLYKTGDRARYRPDGRIEFLGRVDHQVKIRGFRIETAEIESLLLQHPRVREAVVVARENVTGDLHLVTYIVGREQDPTSSELRNFLKEKLPDYMIPAFFVTLPELPLMPNGKVNRLELPPPHSAGSARTRNYDAARNETEKALVEIWKTTLGAERVSIEDNFFDLGGDSILSIQIVSRANQEGILLTPKQIFQHQTIAELAAVAGQLPKVKPEQGVVTGPVPLTPIQRRFFEMNLPNPHHYNQAMVLEIPERIHADLLEAAIHELYIHHDALRLRFTNTKSGWVQLNIGIDSSVPVLREDLSDLSELEQAYGIESTASRLQASLNLANGPLFRVAFFKLGKAKPNRLLFVIHHLVVDGVSWRILLEDLETAYRRLSGKYNKQIPAKTVSFKQWAEYLIDYAKSPTTVGEYKYWTDLKSKKYFSLPIDKNGENSFDSVRTISRSLSQEDTEALLKHMPQIYHTQINDVLLTALLQAFGSWTGEPYLWIDLEGHGREEILEGIDVSRTVGWFTTRFPVQLDLGNMPHQALRTIKEQLRNIPNRGIGYGLLRYLSQDGSTTDALKALPQPQVSFNYLGQFSQLLSGSSLFRLAVESSGPHRDPSGSRLHLLELNSLVVDGELQVRWQYSENIHRTDTIEALAVVFQNTLKTLIKAVPAEQSKAVSPSDFPKARLNKKDWEKFISRIGGKEN